MSDNNNAAADAAPNTAASVANPNHGSYMDQYLENVDYDAIDSEIADDDSVGQPDQRQAAADEEDFDTEDDFVEDDEDIVDEFDDEDVGEDEGEEEEVDAVDLDPNELEVKVTIDGEEKQVSVQELVDNYQLGQSARQRFTEAAKMRQQAEEFIKIVRDPTRVWDVLSQLGHNVDELADHYVVNRYRREQMSPEERRALEAEEKLKQYEVQLQRQQHAEQQRQQQELAKQFEADIRTEVTSAMENAGLPKSKAMFAEVVKTMYEYKTLGHQINPTQAVKLTKKRLQEQVSGLFSSTESAEFDKILSEEEKTVAKKARAKAARRRTGQKRKKTRADAPTVNPVINKAKKEGKDIKSSDDFFKLL